MSRPPGYGCSAALQVDLQPTSGGALAGAASEAVVAAVAEDLTARMPGAFDLQRARAAAPAVEPGRNGGGSGEPGEADGLPPTWVALLQELERWNSVRSTFDQHFIFMLCMEMTHETCSPCGSPLGRATALAWANATLIAPRQ